MRGLSLVFVLLLVACSGGLTNRMNEKLLDCGEGFDPARDYIKVNDGGDLVTFPKNLQVTSKGCVERPKTGEIFVANSGRSHGTWLTSSSQSQVKLEPILAAQLPPACNSVVHADGRGFTLNFDLSSNTKSRNLQSLDVQLFAAKRNDLVATWLQRSLAENVSFLFDEASPVLAGEYKLLASVKDNFSNSVSVSECVLRVDYSALLISPAESVKTRRDYNGQEVLVVQPGYNVNFYVHEGFRDVSIDYCLKRISVKNVKPSMDPELLKCENPSVFLNSKSQSLDGGFWILNYRGQRGLVQNAWQHAVFMVEKTCTGIFRSPSELLGKECTTIRGGLELGAAFDEPLSEELSALDSVGVVYGNVTTAGRFANADVLPNLTEIYGNATLDAMLLNSNFLPSLKNVWGNLTLPEAPVGFEKFSHFKSLVHISGNLVFKTQGQEKSYGLFPELRIVEGLVEITSANDTGLKYFGNLEICGGFKIQSPRLVNLTGLERLKSIGSLELISTDDIENFNGLGAKSVEDLRVGTALNLTQFSISAERLIVTKSLELTGLNRLRDLTSLEFAKTLGSLKLLYCHLPSLAGLNTIENIHTIELRESGIKDLKVFSALKNVHSFLIDDPLSDLKGLSSIENIGEMFLEGYDGSISLAGLDRITTRVQLHLTSFSSISVPDNGLPMKWSLTLRNSKVKNLEFLRVPSLSLSGLYLIGNPLLTDLSGLENFRTIDHDVAVDSNPELASLDGIHDLSIGGNLYIGAQRTADEEEFGTLPKLVNFSALQNIRSVRGKALIKSHVCISKSILDKLSATITGDEIWSEFRIPLLHDGPEIEHFDVKQPPDCNI